MTRPRPVSARYGWAARQSNQAPVRLTAIERSKSVRLMSPIGPRTLIPALFTRTSTLPNRSIAASTMTSAEPSSATPAATVDGSPLVA